MKYLIEFLNDCENSQVYKLIKCSQDEVKILKFLLKNYLEQNPNLNVSFVLSENFKSEDFEHLNKIESIINLIEFGFINLIEQRNFTKKEKLAILNMQIELSQTFLKLLQNGEFEKYEPKVIKYSDEFDYLKDEFARVELYKRRATLGKIVDINEQIIELEDIIKSRLKLTKEKFYLDSIFIKYSLNQAEQLIFLALLKDEYMQIGENSFSFLLNLVSIDEHDKMKNKSLLSTESNLVTSGVLDFEDSITFQGLVIRNFYISEEILQNFYLNKKENQKVNLTNIVGKSEIFELIEPTEDLKDIILNEKIKELLSRIQKQVDKKVLAKLNSWGIKASKELNAKIIFYGKPGTGKTFSAYALAKSLKKSVLSFDCSKILSKFVGESEQNVRKIFDSYKQISQSAKNRPILLLNEADQFLSTRVESSSSSTEKMHNQMQNIFLEQLENFEGILIATTNFLESLDRAFSRRFDYKIEFKKPTYEERVLIWEKLLPKNVEFESNFDINNLAHYELSGAQIKLVIKNASLKVAVSQDEIFKESDFLEEIKREVSSDFENEKKVGLL